MPASPQVVGAYLAAAGGGYAALTTAEMGKLSRVCGLDLAGARDRALFQLAFAGALRRSELVALDVGRVTWTGGA